MMFESNTSNDIDLNEFNVLIKLSSDIFDRKTSTDEALVKQAKLELLKDLYDSKIMGNFYYYNNSYNLLEKKRCYMELSVVRLLF